MCGYESVDYFAKVFKKSEGLPLSAYRKLNKINWKEKKNQEFGSFLIYFGEEVVESDAEVFD